MAKTKKKEVPVDRRTKASDRRGNAKPVTKERRKVQRRRQIDPTTCERDYKDDELEFMRALDDYKQRAGRMFPTCSEILEVLQDLGYARLTAEEQAARDTAREDADEPQGQPA